mgnify:CR=1 FL=1
MNALNKGIFISILLFAMSCEEVTEVNKHDIKQTYFFKSYGSSYESFGRYVDEINGGDILIAGVGRKGTATDNNTLSIRRVDSHGNTVWEKDIETNEYYFCNGMRMSNGDYVFNSVYESSEIIRISPDGEVIYHRPMLQSMNNNLGYGIPIENENGNLLVSFTNGFGLGGNSSNFIYTIDKDGAVIGSTKYNDAQFGGKITDFKVLAFKENAYWLTGTLYESPFTGWGNPQKTFVAKFEQGAPQKVFIKDAGNSKERVCRVGVFSSDDGAVVVSSKTSELHDGYPLPQTFFEVTKLDENLELLWEKKIELGVLSIEPLSMNENSAGEYVISGHCALGNSSGRQAFVVKLNTSGEITFSKIFDLGESIEVQYGMQTISGDYLFTGESPGFGNTIEQTNIVLLKTDKNGNR